MIRATVAWLIAPLGGPTIGDATYREVADREGLSIERDASWAWCRHGASSTAMASTARAFHRPIRDFYEHTSDFKMDVSKTYFPASIGLALLVTTISRQVDQLNFPLSPLDTAHGITSEIISMREPDGRVKYTGWFRTLASSARVLYTGFYMTARVPGAASPCVKVAFPMPNGNATVVLRPIIEPDGALVLDSHGGRFGGPGFYRVQERSDGRLRVWMIRTLVERFRRVRRRQGRAALRPLDPVSRASGAPAPLQNDARLTTRSRANMLHAMAKWLASVLVLAWLLVPGPASLATIAHAEPTPGPTTPPPPPDTVATTAPVDNDFPHIYLVTMGVGAKIWERHGHIALCVQYTDDHREDCYNYGVASFEHPLAMAAGFFRGTHSFWVAEMTPGRAVVGLQASRSHDLEQPLPNLTDEQAWKVVDKLKSDI